MRYNDIIIFCVITFFCVFNLGAHCSMGANSRFCTAAPYATTNSQLPSASIGFISHFVSSQSLH